MILAFVPENGRLRASTDALGSFATAVWLDVVSPTPDEERAIEERLGIDLPTREEMLGIEISSRLYIEDNHVFMTARLPARTDSDDLLVEPVTFVLADGKLVTVRYHEPRVFKTFPQRAEKTALGCTNGEVVLMYLLEATSDRKSSTNWLRNRLFWLIEYASVRHNRFSSPAALSLHLSP